MNKLLIVICVLFITSLSGFAQTNKDYKKNEVYIGYMGHLFDTGPDTDVLHGIQTSYVRNVHRFVGIKGDVSSVGKRDRVIFNGVANGTSFSVRTRTRNTVSTFMGGIEVKDNASNNRVVPFGHALLGVMHVSTRVRSFCRSGNCPAPTLPDADFGDTGLSAAFGGGLDIKLSKAITLRAIQVDYPIYSNGRVGNNLRFGAGIIIK